MIFYAIASDYTKLLKLAEHHKTNQVIQYDPFISEDIIKSFYYFFFDIKEQIDRWDLSVDTAIFPTLLKDWVFLAFQNDLSALAIKIYGVKILFSESIDVNTVLMLDLENLNNCLELNEFPDRCIAVGKINGIEKLNALKAFW